jgi:hypothetical protein
MPRVFEKPRADPKDDGAPRAYPSEENQRQSMNPSRSEFDEYGNDLWAAEVQFKLELHKRTCDAVRFCGYRMEFLINSAHPGAKEAARHYPRFRVVDPVDFYPRIVKSITR